MMVIAEVIHASDDKHASHEGLGLLSKMASTASQPGQALPEGSIEPFDIGRVDHATILGGVQ